MANGVEFPSYVKVEYQKDASTEAEFVNAVESMMSRATASVTNFAQNAKQQLDSALSVKRNDAGALDLGVAQMREAAAAQQLRAIAAREVANASLAAAKADSVYTQEQREAIAAARALANAEEERAAAMLRSAAAAERVQAQLDQQKSSVTSLTGSFIALARAEAEAANGAQMLAAISASTGLDRMAKSARESASAFEVLFQARAAQDERAAQNFLSTAFALDQQAKSARDSAAAFEQMFQIRAAQDERAAQNYLNEAFALDQQSKSARESAVAFEQMFRVRAAQDERAAQNFLNEAFALDQQSKSARESAAAFEEMFAAQERNAAGATQLRAQLDPMFTAQQRFNTAMDQADDLLRAGAITTREYAQAQQLARDNLREHAQSLFGLEEVQKRGTTAQGNVINSVRASRVAFVQLGQQMQDVTVQAQMGTSAMTIFTQQVPQAAFALSGLADSANKTQARIGQVATFLSGPWGAAIFAATAVLGPFIYSLFQSGEAADEAKTKTFDFAGGLDVLTLSAKDATSAMEQLAQSLRSAIKLQGDFLTANAAVATQSVASLEARITASQAELSRLKREADGPLAFALPSVFGPSAADLQRQKDLRSQIAADSAALKGAQAAAGSAALALGQRNVAEARDPTLARLRQIDEEIGKLNRRREQSARTNDPLSGIYITQGEYETELNRLVGLREEAEKANKEAGKSDRGTRSRKRGGGVDRATAEAERKAEQLARFADQASERIQRLNEQFDEQPSLIDQAARSTRELDGIIADLEKRKPIDWEKMVAEARDAQATIEDALVRPFEQLREESERRLQIEELLTAGRETEAAVLQTIWQVESRIGKLTGDQKDQVREIVEYEEARLEVLRQQQDQIGMYLEATRSIRGELESFFAGEGANFGRIARRLQAQYSVEKLFGPAFREIDKAVKTQFDSSVDKLATTTDRTEESLRDLADVVTDTANRMRGGGPLSGPGTVSGIIGGNVAAGFASLTRIGIARAGVPIVANAAEKPNRDSIGGMTPAAYFEMLGKSLTAPLIDQLEGLGIKLPAALKGALGGAAGGFLAAGPVGAVLGSLQGLGIPGGMDAAAQGGQIDSLLGSLGVKSSQSGAALGAAIGSFIPIPGGQIIGAIAGGLLGGALKSTKRGSAIIGGTGDGLGVSGFYGNSGSRKDQAGGFAGDAIEAVNRIAKQLGGEIDASLGKVSIGIREDRIVVDPQGRGFTKTSKFPDLKDFGDDAQAAIAFAVRNLIEDGVLKGLKDSEMRLIKAGDDIEAALQDVLDFRSVFQRLRAYKDPVGAALDELDTEFTRLEELFTRAGASAEEFAQLEELYGIERARALEEASERVMGSLRKLLDDINTGDMGLSLRDRRDNLLPEFNALRARVDAGDVTAFDKYDEVSRQLLELERELFGSQSGYFERLFDVRDTAGRALAEQQQLADQAANRDSPFATRNGEDAGVAPVVDSIQWLGGYLVDNLGGQLEGLADAISSLSAPLNNFVTTRNLGSPSMPVITGQLSY